MRISVQNSLLVGQTTTFPQVQLGVDTIAILCFAQARKMCQLQKWNISEWIYNSKQTSNIPAGRLNKPFVEILLNFQTRRNLLSRCINYILQS